MERYGDHPVDCAGTQSGDDLEHCERQPEVLAEGTQAHTGRAIVVLQLIGRPTCAHSLWRNGVRSGSRC